MAGLAGRVALVIPALVVPAPMLLRQAALVAAWLMRLALAISAAARRQGLVSAAAAAGWDPSVAAAADCREALVAAPGRSAQTQVHLIPVDLARAHSVPLLSARAAFRAPEHHRLERSQQSIHRPPLLT